MGKAESASEKYFARLARQLAGSDEGQLPHREGKGTGSLFAGKKMFAILDKTGSLVLKLSPAKVQELIAAGVGVPWHPGTGKPLKEYVSVSVESHAKWLDLAMEAREFMSSKR
jgi:hypothetical protein